MIFDFWEKTWLFDLLKTVFPERNILYFTYKRGFLNQQFVSYNVSWKNIWRLTFETIVAEQIPKIRLSNS